MRACTKGAPRRPRAGGRAVPLLAAQLSKDVNRHVIVILRSQLAAAHVASRAAAARSDAITAFQAPLMSEPRQVGLTITPSGTSGTVVRGNLYVDDFARGVPPYGQLAGNEAAIPYAYTIT